MAKKTEKPFDFEGLRKRLGLTQPEMAQQMCLSNRTYFALEKDPSAVSQRHIMLAQMVSLKLACDRQDRELADPGIAALADGFYWIRKDDLKRKCV